MTEQNKFFTIERQVSAELISDTLITAVESAISYWCSSMISRFKNESDIPYYANCFDYNWMVEIYIYDEPDSIILDINSIEKGIQIMSDNYPKHYMDMLNEEGDAITADVLFQCIAFGEVVYG